MMGAGHWSAVGLVLALAGCQSEAQTALPFRSQPVPLPVAPSLVATSGVLTGRAYVADRSTLDAKTGLPQGYRLLSGPSAMVLARAEGQSGQWRSGIASGSFRLEGLPIGPTLSVTLSNLSWSTRTQTVVIPRSGRQTLSFEYVDGGRLDSYLLPPLPTAGY